MPRRPRKSKSQPRPRPRKSKAAKSSTRKPAPRRSAHRKTKARKAPKSRPPAAPPAAAAVNADALPPLPSRWDELVAIYPLRPIRDQPTLAFATTILQAAPTNRQTADQADYLESLAILVAMYQADLDDRAHAAAARSDRRRARGKSSSKSPGLAALRQLVNDHDLSAADLARILDVHRSTASKLLLGHRNLTLAQIRTLSASFGVGVETFIE